MVKLQDISTMSSHRKLLARALVIIVGCLECGCTQTPTLGGDLGVIYTMARTMLKGGHRVSLDEAAAVPYASIGVRLGTSSEVMLLLASDENRVQLWTSASKIAIVTDNGRIVHSVGFGANLDGHEALPPKNDGVGGQIIRWKADFRDLGLYSMPITCSEQYIGDEKILILGKEIQTRKVESSCKSESEQLDWTFKNTYWRDPTTGFVWRSIQRIHPKLDAIETEILRPPA